MSLIKGRLFLEVILIITEDAKRDNRPDLHISNISYLKNASKTFSEADLIFSSRDLEVGATTFLNGVRHSYRKKFVNVHMGE